MSRPQIQIPKPVLVMQEASTRRRLLWQIGVALFLAVALVALGYGLANRQQVLAYVSGEETLRGQVKQLERELKDARQELVLHQTAVEVSQQAQNSIRQELKSYHAQVAELDASVEFYKSIMSPESSELGLRVDNVAIVAAEAPQEYSIKLMIGQFGGDHTPVQGRVLLSVKGEQQGKSVTLDNAAVLKQESDLRFSFRYFQELKGSLALPEDFEPRQVQVQVVPNSRQLKNVEHQFDWSVKES